MHEALTPTEEFVDMTRRENTNSHETHQTVLDFVIEDLSVCIPPEKRRMRLLHLPQVLLPFRSKHSDQPPSVFGDKYLIQHISLNIPHNKITTIIGASGCGKSTLLRSMNRMNDIVLTKALTTGTIHLRISADDDENVQHKNIFDPDVNPAQLRSYVGMVFQQPVALQGSILQNVTYGLDIKSKLPKQERSEKAEEVLKMVYLWEEVKNRLNSNPIELSGGQLQRLCLARTLITGARVLLMDEPTAALDPIATNHFESLIRELSTVCSVVIVTHNLAQAMRIGDETVFIARVNPNEPNELADERFPNIGGSVVEQGETSWLFNSSSNPLTRRFISGAFG